MSTAVEPTSQIHTTESLVSDITPGTNTPTTTTSDASTLIQEQAQEQTQEDDKDTLSKDQKVPEHTKTTATVTAAVIVPQADLDAELMFCKDRLEAIEKEERTGADPEKVALEELEKSTRTLISVRERLAAKQEQLEDPADSTNRDGVQAEIDTLAKESSKKEHQWSATKEVYHREFGAIVEDASRPVTVVKAKAELDIKMLQDQIASLQKQLDAVSLKRKEMVADAAEQHRRLVERNGGGIDDE
ncbi:hypothetical protein BG015_001290 [Linnemannia schmuckeri]|uniref:Uncharacterized protein n=1 Tax=Linnemannia schmuckeri TaxID=64567 RepID=A0A9P5S3N6_9FUNG|nr:hypothetical protein BG015_001290 [Linnemannia schmuckeri]